MKIDRHRSKDSLHRRAVGKRARLLPAAGVLLVLSVFLLGLPRLSIRSESGIANAAETSPAADDAVNSPPATRSDAGGNAGRADELVDRVLENLADGPSFDAKIRQRVWALGREVVGVGSYEQAGGGTGMYRMQVSMHDGEGQHTLFQVSDGKLAWTRRSIGGTVTIARVNLGALADESPHQLRQHLWNEIVGVDSRSAETELANADARLPRRLLVGGLNEMIERLRQDYDLRLQSGVLEKRPVWILSGNLKETVRAKVLDEAGRSDWPELYPTTVRLAVATSGDPETGFGAGLPLRLEYRTDAPPTLGRLVSLIELHSFRPIRRPPTARFKFTADDGATKFVDETSRYLQ